MNTAQRIATTDGIEVAGDAAETTPGAFTVGDLLLIDGQVYTCTALTPYWSRRQGREIRLAVFRSLCPDCAMPFEVSVKAICPRPLTRVRNKIPRRCPFCRAGGRRVSKVLHIPGNRVADAAVQCDLGSEGTSTAGEAKLRPALVCWP